MYLEMLRFRFGVVLVHLFVLYLAGNAYHQNIRTYVDFRQVEGSARNEMLREKLDEFQALYALSVICVVWELISIFSGLSSFSPVPGVASIVLNSLGVIITLWYCLDAWPSNSFVGIFLLFSFLPAIIDAGYFTFYACIHKVTRIRCENCRRRREQGDANKYIKLKKDDDDEYDEEGDENYTRRGNTKHDDSEEEENSDENESFEGEDEEKKKDADVDSEEEEEKEEEDTKQ